MSHDLICRAIENREVIQFRHKGRLRTVEPHLVGYDADGDLTLSCWQLSGGSGRDWRDFHIAKLTELSTTGERFAGARPGYNPNDSTISRIVCRL